VRLRTLGAVVAAVLALAGLAGCRTNVGTAASVTGHRITESDVNDYVRPSGPDPAFVKQVEQSGQKLLPPRTFVLHFLIQEQVFQQTLESLHKMPSEARLASSHDAAASFIFQTQLSGTDLDAAIKDGLPKSGVTSEFSSVYIRAAELEYTLIKAENVTSPAQLSSLVKRAGITVSVSPRYGSWDSANLSLQGQVPVPDYLTVQPGASGAANVPTG
jgi:hypothetical protein